MKEKEEEEENKRMNQNPGNRIVREWMKSKGNW